MLKTVKQVTDESMNIGAWRFDCLLFCSLLNAPIALPFAARADTAWDFVSYYPRATLSGSAFLGADGAVIKLTGVQGCLSPEPMEFAGMPTTCAMISLAGMTATLDRVNARAGDAFPCHVLGQNPGRPTVRFAECFFIENGVVRSLSEVLIRQGLAYGARGSAGLPVFPDYLQAGEASRGAQAAAWANGQFAHPSGERYQINPSAN